MIRIKKNIIEEDATRQGMNIITSDENIEELTNKIYEKIQLKIKNINPAKKESLIARKARLLRLVEDGALPYEDLRERLLQIDAELMELSVGASCPTINHYQIRNYVTNMRDGIVNCDQTILSSGFINKIIVDLDGTYEIKFGPFHFGTD